MSILEGQFYRPECCGLKLDNTSLWIACGLRLGSSQCQPHKCICGGLVDESGRHGLSSKNTKETFTRHQQINNILKMALGSAQVHSISEPTGLSRDDSKCPDGMTLYAWSRGRPLVWDVTVRDTLCMGNVMLTTQEAGKAAVKAERTKLSH